VELLLPLGQRPANLRQEFLPPVRQEDQQLRFPGFTFPLAFTCHRL
jgi:hypothetical protein